jgi:putative DNA methylase
MSDDPRLIEDFLPIQAISAEASREKSVRKGHISTLHLWWARRPLVACRAAVYGALVPASRFVPENGPDNKKQSLGRANAAKFIERLCKYPGNPSVIKEAQRHILEAHAERLTIETGKKVTVEDIEEGRAPRPKVLDMFAGGGAIPLEALRLGCEAYALDLNPVAHIIELCTLVYPQKYGKPDPNVRGMTGLPAPRRFWVYVIRCEDDSFYIGQTDNIVRRYEDHLSGKAEWTATHKPVELIHWEEFKTRDEAVAREQGLKTGFGRKWLKREWDAGRLASRQAGPKNAKGLPASLEGLAQPGETTWGGLAEEVRYWGNWVLEKVKAEIGDLYPLIPDPEYKGNRPAVQAEMWQSSDKESIPPGYLMPVAYLWTRTVRCKNPSCGATVPLVRQTWLCKKKDRYVALRMIAPACAEASAGRPKAKKEVRFEVVESRTEKGLGFDPAGFSKGGNATCPFCGTVADSDYVKAEGRAKRMGQQMMSIVCTRPGKQGKVYLSADDYPEFAPDDEAIRARIEALCRRTGLTVPEEPLVEKLTDQLPNYGMKTFRDLFTPRQMLCLLTFAAAVRECVGELERAGVEPERVKAITTYLAILVDRIAMLDSGLCTWHITREVMGNMFARQALPMVWDFAELAPFGGGSGSSNNALEWIVDVMKNEVGSVAAAFVERGSATTLPWLDGSFDAVITDPPYYDNIQYAALSDFFYVWLKRTIGHLYPEHFSAEVSPKKSEAVASPWRHKSKADARKAYEEMMAKSFAEAHRVLKPGGQMTVVYAHKTTLGWSTLVDALRGAGFTVTEAWPLDTEMQARVLAKETAALASSIFLVARKREGVETGSYEDEVRPELERIVRERVHSLWTMGITGADLVIAAVGAGLRAFTRFARVEYANGEEVPAEKFLAEVEGVVLETLLEKIFGMAGSGVAAVDGPSRFYVLWRYAYKAAEMDAGEAIVFTYGQNVELDGQNGLSSGSRALVEKKKGKYRLRDFAERGDDEKLGMPRDDLPAPQSGASRQAGGKSAPLIDILHRILWLLENEPRKLNDFLDEARPDRERLRLVAQALAGTALEGGQASGLSEPNVVTTPAEAAALKKLLANWRALIDQRLAAREGSLFELIRNSEAKK